MNMEEEGDLGFGQGLKPGAILPTRCAGHLEQTSNGVSAQNLSLLSQAGYSRKAGKAVGCAAPLQSQQRPSKEERRKASGSTRRLTRSSSLGSVLHKDDSIGRSEREEDIPAFAGVPLGTSLRQQRALFDRHMKDFLQKKEELSNTPEVKGSAIPASYFAVQESIVNRLQTTTEEVAVLQSELDACRSQLDSKYRAIRILQSQVAALNTEKQKSFDVAKNQAKTLQKEVNALQFELDAKSSTFMMSEQTWSERFDRLSMENATLLATLHARSDEVRRLHAEKMALIRERSELIAMMDVSERLQYDRHLSPKNEAYLHNAAAEQLAMLGACLCRGNDLEPCKCARAAALLKKESSVIKDEKFKLMEELQDAYLVADAFRKAFEEQLNRNSSIGKQLADSSATNTEADRNWKRRKPLLSWIKKAEPKNGHTGPEALGRLLKETIGIQALVVDELDEDLHGSTRSVGIQVSQPMPDLIRNMADLLNDRSEALAHQRLVTKMLAKKTQDLEATMKKYGNT
ncbi:coiled-coil domain-containing protein 125-like [Diadema setosum]|uniref:coiled-coil domain-containing protein 125-like n=1 Tax=Diadema setosum TaxID=31175 RepID=UPI003B3A6CF9